MAGLPAHQQAERAARHLGIQLSPLLCGPQGHIHQLAPQVGRSRHLQQREAHRLARLRRQAPHPLDFGAGLHDVLAGRSDGCQLEHASPAVSQTAPQPEQLVFGCERSRHRFAVHGPVREGARGGHAQSARSHGVGHDAFHASDIVGAGGLVAGAALAHHVGPHRAVGNLGAHVNGPPAVVEGVEVVAEGLPAPGDALGQGGAGDVLHALHELDQPFLGAGAHRCEPHSAVAHDHGGDAVARTRLEQIVPGGLGRRSGCGRPRSRG